MQLENLHPNEIDDVAEALIQKHQTIKQIKAVRLYEEDCFEFATNCIWTFDEQTGRISQFPTYPYIRDFIFPGIHEPGNRMWEKSQRMLGTLSFTVYFFWRWLKTEKSLDGDEIAMKFNGWMTSRKDRMVDDGGGGSTWKSLFGKIRFYYNQLQRNKPWVLEFFLDRADIPSNRLFRYQSLVNPKNDNSIVGEAPTPDAGTGEGFTKAFVDEAPLIKDLDKIRGNLILACQGGTHLLGYPDGMKNHFAQVKHVPGHYGMEVKTLHWKLHPEHDMAWYESMKSKMSPYDVARRLDISYQASIQGKVWSNYVEKRNMRGDFPFNIQDVMLSFDFGSIDATSVGFLFPFFMEKAGSIINGYYARYWLELNHTNVEKVSAEIKSILIKLGFTGDTRTIPAYGDPQIDTTLIDSGIRFGKRYEDEGFFITAAPRVETKDALQFIDNDLLANGRLIIHDQDCVAIEDCFKYWCWPVDKQGRIKSSATQPNHDDYSHAGKSLEYFIKSVFKKDTSGNNASGNKNDDFDQNDQMTFEQATGGIT